MNESIVKNKKWLPINIPQGLSPLQLDKLILICAGSLVLRVCKSQAGIDGLELLCFDEEELSEAEAFVHQALADERLRERLSSNINIDIASFVERILMRGFLN